MSHKKALLERHKREEGESSSASSSSSSSPPMVMEDMRIKREPRTDVLEMSEPKSPSSYGPPPPLELIRSFPPILYPQAPAVFFYNPPLFPTHFPPSAFQPHFLPRMMGLTIQEPPHPIRLPPDITVEKVGDDRREEDFGESHSFSNSLRTTPSPSPSPSPSTSATAAAEETTPPQTTRPRRRRRADDLVPPDCPLSRRQIVDLPIDEFNELIERHSFSEAQKAQYRDWRRKGKNRVAAKKSREKRMQGIEELKRTRDQKERTLQEAKRTTLRMERERDNLRRAVEYHERIHGILRT